MRKEISFPFNIYTNAVMTGTNVLTSDPTNILYRDSVAIELSWTGTPTGTFVVQGSNSYNPGTPQSDGGANAGVWTTITVTDQNNNPPAASGSAGQILMNLNQLAFVYIRIVYTNASGSGVLNGNLCAKSLG